MKNLVLILSALMICTASFFLSSCNDTKGKETIAQQTTEQNLPELLKRNNAIGSAEEIEFVMTTYDNAVDAIGANPKNAKAHLKLAELFVLEARATGEHGHYYPAALHMI
mgnify:FL=1